MRRVWATAGAISAVAAVTAVLAWARPHAAAPPPAQPTVLVVRDKAGHVVAVPAAAPASAAHATTRTS
jgi:hypothetical protein